MRRRAAAHRALRTSRVHANLRVSVTQWPVTGSGRWQLPVLVESQEGYRNLCRLVTRMKMRGLSDEHPAVHTSSRERKGGALILEELEGWTTGLVAIGGRRLLDGQYYGVGGLLDRLVGIFGRRNVCVELQRHLLRDDETENVALEALARAFRVPMVATNGVRFAEPAERPLFDVLTCIRHRTTLDAAGRRLARNAERYLKPPEAMARLFADRPEALMGVEALAERQREIETDLGGAAELSRVHRDAIRDLRKHRTRAAQRVVGCVEQELGTANACGGGRERAHFGEPERDVDGRHVLLGARARVGIVHGAIHDAHVAELEVGELGG